jgi:hypothetical protein
MSRSATFPRTLSESRARRRAASVVALAALAAVPRVGLAQTDFSAQIRPNPATLTAGGSSVMVTVTTSVSGALREPITYSFTGLPAGISTGGPQTVVDPHPPATFTFAASGSVAPGTYSGTLLGTTSSTTRTFPFAVNVAPPADFTLAVAPTAISLEPGQSRTVTLVVTATGGLSSNVQVIATAPAGLTVQPSMFSVAPGGQTQLLVTVSGSATPGLGSITFVGTAPGVSGTRTTALAVTVLTSPPVILSVTPPSIVTGTSETVLRITGSNFDPNAVITSTSPGLQVVRARVLSSTTAEVVVSVRPDAPPGPVQLDLRNPNGAMAAGGARLLVYAARSLSAPLAVTSAVIASPRHWENIAPGDNARARALLATSGMGTLVGMWLLDGVPFDQFTRVVSGGFPVEVVSAIPIPLSFTGEHRLELLIETPQGLPVQGVSFIQVLERRTRIQLLSPTADAALDPSSAVFRWTLVPGASGYEVEIEGAADTLNGQRQSPEHRASRRHRTSDNEWRPGALLREFGVGAMRVRVRAIFPGEVPGEATPWLSFTIAAGDGSASVPADVRVSRFRLASTSNARSVPVDFPVASDETTARRSQMELTLNSTTTHSWYDVADAPPITRLQLSKQFDLHAGGFNYQATADASGMHDLDTPWKGRAENANWLARFGNTTGRVEQEARIGFAPPSFFDQSEFLSVFTSGGALQGSLASPIGRVSYFHTARLGGYPGMQDAEATIEAAAYEAAKANGRFLFRTMLLRVTEPDFDGLATGNRGTALGFIGVFNLSPRLSLVGEVARGDLDPGVDSFEQERDGQALRLSAKGASQTFGYSLAIGRTNEGFVNPANPGFTPGGISGRTRAELALQKLFFGKALWSGSHSWVRGGVALLTGDPKTTENGSRMSLSVPLSQRVSFTLGGNVTAQDGDGHEELGFPEVDRTQKGAEVSVSERIGRFTLMQGWTWQRLADGVQPFFDQSVTAASFTATGALTSFLNLSANVADTRDRPTPELGQTTRLLVALQPSLSINRFSMQLAPRGAFSRARNETQQIDFRSAMYQATVRWQPGWAGSLIALEVSSDWKRSWSALDPERPPFERTTVGTLSLNWRADRNWGSRRADPGVPR